MKVTIIDCRNRTLDKKLLNSSHLLVSTILPSPAQPLPREIKTLLTLNTIFKKHQPAQFDIIIEINSWMNRSEAIGHLKYTHSLLKRFFLESGCPAPSCQLAIVENNRFISISPKQIDQANL